MSRNPHHSARASTLRMQGRRLKAMYLPMPRREADDLILPVRMALETVRRAQADRRSTGVLAQTMLLTSFITETGHGRLEQVFLDDVERALDDVLTEGKRSGEWHFPSELLEDLCTVVNEYDRMLREARLEIIARATEQLDRLLERSRAA